MTKKKRALKMMWMKRKMKIESRIRKPGIVHIVHKSKYCANIDSKSKNGSTRIGS